MLHFRLDMYIWFTKNYIFKHTFCVQYPLVRVCFLDLIDSFSVSCEWGPWSEFSNCDKTCGGGKMFRNRTKLVTEQYGGTCPGLGNDVKECNIQNCPGKLQIVLINLISQNCKTQ